MAKKSASSPFPTVLRWQLSQAEAVSSAACDEAWLASQSFADDELAALVLQRPECSQELLERARAHRSPQVRAKLLARADLPPEMLAALLGAEKRASVLGELLGAGAHPAEVSRRAAEVFAEKPTVTLATELVRAPMASASARVEAALVLLPRFNTLPGALQGVLRTLPDKILDASALERFVLATTETQMLHRALRTGRCTPPAQLHAAEVLLLGPIRRVSTASSQNQWAVRSALRELTAALSELAAQPHPAPELAAVVAVVRAWPGFAQSPAALSLLAQLEALDAAAPLQDYAELARAAQVGGDQARARALVLDPACPSELLVPLAPLLGEYLGPDVFDAARARAGHDAFLTSLASSVPGEFLANLGWGVFADPAAAEPAVLGALRARDIPSLARAGITLTPSQARLVPWATLREYATRSWFPQGSCPLATASISAQAAALGTRRERWEVFASLAADHTGTLGELLDACALVLGERPEEAEEAPAGSEAAAVSEVAVGEADVSAA